MLNIIICMLGGFFFTLSREKSTSLQRSKFIKKRKDKIQLFKQLTNELFLLFINFSARTKKNQYQLSNLLECSSTDANSKRVNCSKISVSMSLVIAPSRRQQLGYVNIEHHFPLEFPTISTDLTRHQTLLAANLIINALLVGSPTRHQPPFSSRQKHQHVSHIRSFDSYP